jgi:hypothetical protein
VLLLAGCATHPPERTEADGRYCYRTGDRLYVTCTDDPVPPAEVDSEVKRFEPTPGMLTVFIVRQRWADTVNRVEIRVDDTVTAFAGAYRAVAAEIGRQRTTPPCRSGPVTALP